MSTRLLYRTFARWRARGEPLVLATVVETAGSTYSKAGAQMLIDAAGNYQGLISGGCLEGDLCDQARDVAGDGAARLVRYDMRDAADDEIWGLGLGCEGAISILLQRLAADTDYRPLSDMEQRVADNRAHVYALVVESADESLRAGSGVIVDANGSDAWGLPGTLAGPLAALCRPRLGRRDARLETHTLNNASLRVLVAPVSRPLSLLLLGAGPDAVPLIRFATQMGWTVTVADHRDRYLERLREYEPERIIAVEPARLQSEIDAADYDAAVVMSHHLRSDRDYLRELAGCDIGYIGLLGPPARRDRLLNDLGTLAATLRPRLRAPVGLDIGARGAEAIALSIVTQLYATFHRDEARTDG